jgi:disintegrin and metalloproteinase domain-containing protein 10
MKWSSLKPNSLSSVLSINFLLLIILYCFVAQALNPLNEYISHYEPLTYDTSLVLSRAKRSLSQSSPLLSSQSSPESEPIIIEFKSHGRHFSLRLRRDYSSVFHKDLVIESSDGKPINVNLDHIVSGELVAEPKSKVFGAIREGVFEGKIHTQNDQTFYVEKAFKYFNSSDINNKNNNSLPFHSVIYNAIHVNDPYRHKRSIIDGACGADENVREWMSRIANSGVDTENSYSDSLLRNKRASGQHNYWTTTFEAQGRIGPANKPTQTTTNRDTPFVPQKRACSLYIQTDTYLWDHIKKNEPSDAKAREEISSLVAQHIKAVNHIYETSVFKDIYGLKFIVQRLKINDSSACDTQLKRDTNQFCSPNIDVSNFLNLNSQFNHNDFCLAYIFTYRDFSGGTLGLAWVASTSGTLLLNQLFIIIYHFC